MGMLLRYKWAITLTGCDTGRCASLSGEAPPVLVYDRINWCLPGQDAPSTLRGPGRRKSVRWADEAGDEDAGFSIGGAALRQLETVYVLEGLGPPKEGPAAPKSFAEQVNPDGGSWAGLLQSSGCTMQLFIMCHMAAPDAVLLINAAALPLMADTLAYAQLRPP